MSNLIDALETNRKTRVIWTPAHGDLCFAAAQELRRLNAENDALRISIKYEEGENQKDFDALRAELAAVRKDAERYRLLRTYLLNKNGYCIDSIVDAREPYELDNAIDAELEKTNG